MNAQTQILPTSMPRSPSVTTTTRGPTAHELYQLIKHEQLTALFQPVVDLRSAEVVGYEGLIRGPSDSQLHAPGKLFKAARQAGLIYELENLCGKVIVERFVESKLPGTLFINISPDLLLLHDVRTRHVFGFLRQLALDPARVVIELSETDSGYDFRLEILGRALERYRALGYRIAIDDWGGRPEELASLAAIAPDYLKIDRHFIQNIDTDAIKRRYVRQLLEQARALGWQTMAEGIESHSELTQVTTLGIVFGQGYHLGRPSLSPSAVLSADVIRTLAPQPPLPTGRDECCIIEHRLLIRAAPVTPDTPNCTLFDRFEVDPDLNAIAVVKDDQPVGLVNRHALIDRLARPYHLELFGRRPCAIFMDPEPLLVDKNLSLQQLSYLVAGADRRHLSNGFIITEEGRYLGIGTGHDLIREITDLQIQAARYANPLTQLPGNVPINERINQLLARRLPFVACYCDLDHFKPFNDVYGFSRGDELIRLTGKLLLESCHPEHDFLGHIGGDDFIALFRTPDWESRCQQTLERFGTEVAGFFNPEDQERGGYLTENRRGEKEFHPLTTLSIGAVVVPPGLFSSYMEISQAASETKKMAKRQAGNSLYINRRDYAHRSGGPHAHQP